MPNNQGTTSTTIKRSRVCWRSVESLATAGVGAFAVVIFILFGAPTASAFQPIRRTPLLRVAQTNERQFSTRANTPATLPSSSFRWNKQCKKSNQNGFPTLRAALQEEMVAASLPEDAALLPKRETNVDSFLQQHPRYNGEGVTIGVLDTGIDPAALGMQWLPNGEAKLIDVVDCSGGGDVPLAQEVQAVWKEKEGDGSSAHWEVTLLSGRTIQLPGDWKMESSFPKPLQIMDAKTSNSTNSSSDNKTNAKPEEPSAKESTEASDGAPAPNPDAADAAEASATAPPERSDEKEATSPVTTSPSTTPSKTAAIRLGLKSGYELYPTRVVTRVKAHRKKLLEAAQAKHAEEVRRELEDWHAQFGANNPTREQVKVRDDLQARLEILKDANSNGDNGGLEDVGPLYDCLVYWDGTHYRAAILDTTEPQDALLKSGKTKGMTAFREEREFGTFGVVDQVNYALNFYDDASTLSIVVDTSPHGSHVAGIAAGYVPPSTTLDGSSSEHNNDSSSTTTMNAAGVAPGAKLISLKIGERRLGGMETGTAICRAMIEAQRLGCDVVNMSYGEGCRLADRGRLVELADELVHRHNVIFVSSAGNEGPGLTTVGALGGTTNAVISVGAFVSTDMMKAEYSMIDIDRTWKSPSEEDGWCKEDEEPRSSEDGGETDPISTTEGDCDPEILDTRETPVVGATYTWSSNGPTVDGENGVDFVAPGGAIASVSRWTLQRRQLMNGTSMSSPHAAGCVALLLSACKAEGIKITPSRIRRALQNTAKRIEGLSQPQQGFGLLQVDKAWEYLCAHKDKTDEDIQFKVRTDGTAGKWRGIYLRQPGETSNKRVYSVTVDPKFGMDDYDEAEAQQQRVEYEGKFRLVSSAPEWVRVPDYFVLVHNGRAFKVEIDPSDLDPGLHTALITGYDAEPGTDRQAVFTIPVTVTKPLEEAQQQSLGVLEFERAEVKRYFLSVPQGATWMDVTIRDIRDAEFDKDATARMVVLHAIQLLPNYAFRDNEFSKTLYLQPGQSIVKSISVQGGKTLELALARHWTMVAPTAVEVSVEFRGVIPKPEVLNVLFGSRGTLVGLSSELRDERVLPSARFTRWLTPVRPKPDSRVTPLGERDVLATNKKKILQLILTYEFKQEEAGAFTPRAIGLQGYLYESAFESQLMLIFDGEKKLLGVADSWPDEVKAPKGPVTIRLQIRHDNAAMLEKLKDHPIWIDRKLSREIVVSSYPTREDLMKGTNQVKAFVMKKGTYSSVFVSEPPVSKLPSGVSPGDVLQGKITYCSGEASLPGDGKRPIGFALRYTVGPKVDKPKSENGKAPELPDERSLKEKFDEAVRDQKVKELSSLTEKEKNVTQFEQVYGELVAEYPDHVPLLMARLKYYDAKDRRSEHLRTVMEAANSVIRLSPETEIAAHFGVKYDKDDAKSCKERKDMDEKKGFLTEALARKAHAAIDLEKKAAAASSSDVTANDAVGKDDSFDECLKHLAKWIDIDSGGKYASLAIQREEKAGRFGSLLKLLNTHLKNDGEDTKAGIFPLTRDGLLELRSKTYKNLGYDHLVELDEKMRLVASPKDFATF